MSEKAAESKRVGESFNAALLKAFIALAFGIVLVSWPSATLNAFLTIFGIFALCFGVFQLVVNFTGEQEREHRTAMIVLGVVSVIAGILALAWPSASARVILIIIGIWAIGMGGIEMLAAFRLPKEFSGRWWLAGFAIVSIGVGVWLLIRQGQNSIEVASIVIVLVGVFAIVEGVLLAVYAYYLRKYAKSHP